MKKKAIILIIVLAAASLVGIVLTQLYWVKKAYELKEEQFDNSVRIAVKTIINQFLEQKNDSVFKQNLAILKCRKTKLDVTDIVIPEQLDSLMHDELGSMAIDSNYYYALYKRQSNKFVTGRYEGFEKQLAESRFQFSVAGLYRPGDYYLAIYFPGKVHHLMHQMELWLVLSIVFVIILIATFVSVIFTIVRQTKLSELKNDFINNLTHEFKTPIATSSLAAEMLLRSEMEHNPGKIKKYATVILDENHRLQKQLDQMLQLAALKIGRLKYRLLKVDVHKLINNVIASFDLRIKENKISLETHLIAKNHNIVGDKEHLQNVFFNLVDNAIKYSPVNPVIKISTWNVDNGIMIRVEDNGIGIKKEYQKEIFKNLYRVPTGNIHETRGFGLGLYYVKTVVDQHSGHIHVVSQVGTGSKFNLFLPFKIQ